MMFKLDDKNECMKIFFTMLLMFALIPYGSGGEEFVPPQNYWLIGDSHVLNGSGLAIGLNMAIVNNGDKFYMDSRVGARPTTFMDFTKKNHLSPDDKIIISLGINSSRMSLHEAGDIVDSFIDTLGGRECFWILPPVEAENETPGYWDMMRETASRCHVFDSKVELNPSKRVIMGKFHLKIGYAKKVWAPRVWNWIMSKRRK